MTFHRVRLRKNGKIDRQKTFKTDSKPVDGGIEGIRAVQSFQIVNLDMKISIC